MINIYAPNSNTEPRKTPRAGFAATSTRMLQSTSTFLGSLVVLTSLRGSLEKSFLLLILSSHAKKKVPVPTCIPLAQCTSEKYIYIAQNVKCCVIRSLDKKLSRRNRIWEFCHLFRAPLAQLREEAARTPCCAFPIYKAPRTSPLCCKAHSVKLCEYFIMNNSFARF